MTRSLTVSALAVALLATIACGQTAEQKQAEAAAKTVAEAAKTGAEAAKSGADQMAAGAAAMAKGLEQMAKGAASADVMPFETLGSSFPEVSGWKRSEITGKTSNFPMKVSNAEANYRDGDKRIRLEVVDATLAQMMLVPFSAFLAANYSERSSEGYKKGTSVQGQPAFEDVNTKGSTAEMTVVVAKRFIVTARGADGASIDNVRALVEKMDFGKLTAGK